MDDQTIKEVTDEMAPLLRGRAPGKIFQLSPLTMAIDFRAREGYLLLSADPQMPRLHLIKRRVRDLEKQSGPLNQFSLTVRKELAGTTLLTIRKDKGDRILRFQFSGKDELGKEKHRTLVAQLTGRSANLFLLDEAGTVRQSARPTKLPGQQAGETYEKPESSQLPEVKSV
jgi:predicted ribosome quality control (RQC) complex YloA/Tae2 family protein